MPLAVDFPTAPGFLFEIGNATLAYLQSNRAGNISLSVAAFALTMSVIRHTRRLNIQTEGRIALMLGCYGIGNSLMGIARAVEQGSKTQKILDSVAYSFAATGSYFAGENSNWASFSLFGSSAALSIAQAFEAVDTRISLRNGKKVPLAPEVLDTAGYGVNAANSASLVVKAANAGFGLAYLSILALKETNGKGLYEYGNKLFSFDKKHEALIARHDETARIEDALKDPVQSLQLEIRPS